MDGNQLGDLPLSPAQERVAQTIEGCARNAQNDRGGRILFVGGETGSGKSHLLQTVASRLSHDPQDFQIATGGVSMVQAEPAALKWRERAEALIASAASVASALDPSLSLVGPIANFSTAAAAVLEAMVPGLTSTELVTRVLRAATRNASGQPLICLIDDADWLGGVWWTEMQFSFAKEVAEELSLVLVLAVDGDPRLAEDSSEDDPPPQRVARSLIARNLAEWTALERLTSLELNDWLGPSQRAPLLGVLNLTGGRSGDALELWRTWVADGVISKGQSGSWELARPKALEHDALTRLAALVERDLPEANPTERETIREALAFGALEGRSFTAAAVADAIACDRDAMEDLLDELVVDPTGDGVLRPPRAIDVHDLKRSRSWSLWRYEFASTLLWRAARERLSDRPEETALRLLDSLKKSYEHEVPAIAPVMARLADLSGQSTLISHYRSLVRAPSQMALEAQARYLLNECTESWTRADHRDASYVFSETALRLCFFQPYESLLPFAERAVDHAQEAEQDGRRALTIALLAMGKLKHRLGQIDLAEETLLAARRNSAQGDPSLLANVLCELAEVSRSRGTEDRKAKSLLEEADLLFRRVGNRLGMAGCKYELGVIALREGDLPSARALNQEAMAITHGAGNRSREMTMQFQQAEIEYQDGNPDLARDLVEEALRYQAAVGKVFSEAACLALFARIETTRGNPEVAKDLAESALALHRKLHDQPAEADALRTLAEVMAALEEKDQASQLFSQAREAYVAIGHHTYAEKMTARRSQLGS
jgi:tetratricopeptide (TPR) repeat protein